MNKVGGLNLRFDTSVLFDFLINISMIIYMKLCFENTNILLNDSITTGSRVALKRVALLSATPKLRSA